MKLKIILFAVMIISAILPMIQLIIYYDSLPERVAAHFNAAGEADEFMTKSSFLFLIGGVHFFVSFLFIGIIFFIKKLPLSMINVPNKEYWFTDERKVASYDFFQKAMAVIAITTLLFLFVIMQSTIQYNLKENPEPISEFWIYLAAMLAITFSTVGVMFFRFRKSNEKTEIKIS